MNKHIREIDVFSELAAVEIKDLVYELLKRIVDTHVDLEQSLSII